MINIRKFDAGDIKNKVKWYNDVDIRKYLHYEENFTLEGTMEWFKKVEMDNSRYEYVIEVKNDNISIPIGIIGIFNLDRLNKKSGLYITIGEKNYQGKGLAKKSLFIFLKYIFTEFNLKKIYLYTDKENVTAQKLYEKVGFKKEGCLRSELYFNSKYIDRIYYGILKEEFYGNRKHF